jgi:hypothetical protein
MGDIQGVWILPWWLTRDAAAVHTGDDRCHGADMWHVGNAKRVTQPSAKRRPIVSGKEYKRKNT